MKVSQKNNTTILEADEANVTAFSAELNNFLQKGNDKNIIIDLSSFGHLKTAEFTIFSDNAKALKKSKKSFVIVADTDFNKATKVTIVPTLQEAHDIIEMEEIERDLGF